MLRQAYLRQMEELRAAAQPDVDVMAENSRLQLLSERLRAEVTRLSGELDEMRQLLEARHQHSPPLHVPLAAHEPAPPPRPKEVSIPDERERDASSPTPCDFSPSPRRELEAAVTPQTPQTPQTQQRSKQRAPSPMPVPDGKPVLEEQPAPEEEKKKKKEDSRFWMRRMSTAASRMKRTDDSPDWLKSSVEHEYSPIYAQKLSTTVAPPPAFSPDRVRANRLKDAGALAKAAVRVRQAAYSKDLGKAESARQAAHSKDFTKVEPTQLQAPWAAASTTAAASSPLYSIAQAARAIQTCATTVPTAASTSTASETRHFDAELD